MPVQKNDITDIEETNQNESTDLATSEPANPVESESDISPIELELLDSAGTQESGDDDEQLSKAQLDETDDDGDVLNEEIDLTGSDLDVPGADADDENESIGEEDEENNAYSTASQDDDGDNEA
ncbi:MAG: hypothetical protein ABIN94_15185 [Ferruginibacter sp.]